MRYLGKRFSTYPWHSVNLIPSAALVMMCSDDDFRVEGTLLELTIFGQVFHVHLPLILTRSHSLPLLGPLWSKRRRVWYRA